MILARQHRTLHSHVHSHTYGISSSGIKASIPRCLQSYPDLPSYIFVNCPSHNLTTLCVQFTQIAPFSIRPQQTSRSMAGEPVTRIKHQSWDPPPQGFVHCYQDADEGVKETLKAAGTYCPSCYTITKDLSVFAEPTDSIGTKAAVVFWSFQLKNLVDTAEGGCHFCGFIASRLLDDRMLTFFYSNNSSTQRVTTCCHLAVRTEVHENVLRSVASLRNFLEKEPDTVFTVAVEPVLDYLEEEKQMGKVRFTLCRTNLSEDVLSKFVGYRSMIVVELYAVKGTHHRSFITTSYAGMLTLTH